MTHPENQMTDSTTQTSREAAASATTGTRSDIHTAESATNGSDPAFESQRRATELAILDALRAVVDPEIGMNVVELALIKQILLGPDRAGEGAGRVGCRS
jgi:hypothetical protein